MHPVWEDRHLHVTVWQLGSIRKGIPYFTVEAPMSNNRPPPIFGEKSCVGLIALELAPTVNYWLVDRMVAQKYKKRVFEIQV